MFPRHCRPLSQSCFLCHLSDSPSSMGGFFFFHFAPSRIPLVLTFLMVYSLPCHGPRLYWLLMSPHMQNLFTIKMWENNFLWPALWQKIFINYALRWLLLHTTCYTNFNEDNQHHLIIIIDLMSLFGESGKSREWDNLRFKKKNICLLSLVKLDFQKTNVSILHWTRITRSRSVSGISSTPVVHKH